MQLIRKDFQELHTDLVNFGLEHGRVYDVSFYTAFGVFKVRFGHLDLSENVFWVGQIAKNCWKIIKSDVSLIHFLCWKLKEEVIGYDRYDEKVQGKFSQDLIAEFLDTDNAFFAHRLMSLPDERREFLNMAFFHSGVRKSYIIEKLCEFLKKLSESVGFVESPELYIKLD